MSTYQGERFVLEQLRSILQQLPPRGRIMVRDDGSSDRTVQCVESLADSRITVLKGQNLGFGASFLTLLAEAPHDADMLMFSDQDDVWLPGKIERAWSHLQPLADLPALYGSAQLLVDSELNPMQVSPPWPRPPSLAGALTENMITGCTAALNRSAIRLLQRAGVPAGVHFHDWWLYLVLSALGRVVVDESPTILYRQHGGNLIGHGAGWFGRQRQILRFLARNDWVGILLAQIGELIRCYGDDLQEPARRLVLDHFKLCGNRVIPRWSLVFSKRRWRHTGFGEIALRVLLALHRLQVWPPPGRRLH